MTQWFSKKDAQNELKKREGRAKALLRDEDKLGAFLHDLERKVRLIPFLSRELKTVPLYLALLRSYWKKDYTQFPFRTLVAIVGALLYFLSPLDVIPDWIPFLGYLDDATVLGVCWKLAEKDMTAYQNWRKNKG